MKTLPTRRRLPVGSSGSLPALLLVAFALTACTSSRTDVALMDGEKPASKNDAYPDFSRPLTSAMSQMTDEEASRMTAQLSALAARRQSGAISQAEYLRRVRELQALNKDMQQGQVQ